MKPHQLRDRLLADGLSPKSVAVYMRAIANASRWCEAHGTTLDRLTATELVAFMATKPRGWSTRALYRSSLGAYWRVTRRRRPPTKAIRIGRQPRMRCKALEPDQAAQLAAAARRRRDAKGLVVMLGLYLALRREEISSLRWDAFDEALEWVTITGKGNVTETLPVHPALRDALAWVDRRGPYVFPGFYGRSFMSPSTAWSWVRGVADEAGLPPVATHRLRHTALATANDATGDLRAVQVFARHADPRQTAGYTRTGPDRLRRVVESIDYDAA